MTPTPFQRADRLKPQSVSLTAAATALYALGDMARDLTRAEKRKIARLIEQLPAGLLPASFRAARAKARKGN